MPSIVLPAEALRKSGLPGKPVATPFAPEIVPRNCRLSAYAAMKVPAFKVSGKIIAYASPDSTYAVTRQMFDAARKSIIIGIYDFTADHVKKLVLQAMQRGVKVELMLDIDSKLEQTLFDELAQFGARCTPAPSCASPGARYFATSHEKVIVIDDRWSLVQSGNYSDNSIPLNVTDGGDPLHFTTGNRDTGLAIDSRPLAAFFRKVLEADIKLELAGPKATAAAEAPADTFLVEAAPSKRPAQLYPSRTFALGGMVTVQPVLSPDNYMDVVPAFLRTAKKSILIEQQYIRAEQPLVRQLLEAIAAARSTSPGLDVRIVLGKVFDPGSLPQERANLQEMEKICGLVLGTNIRYVDTSRLVHCHNKMALVDGSGVLVSSQNWSDPAVSKNREAGVLLAHAGIRDYFAAIFETDWSTALKNPGGDQPSVVSPEAVRKGGFMRVMGGDYAEV